MKYTIKGLTDATLTLTKLNITLRGNSNKLDLYPNSIAKGVVVNTPDQMAEIQSLVKNKFIVAIPEEQEGQQVNEAPRVLLPQASPPLKGTNVKDLCKEDVYGEIAKLAGLSANLSKDANELLNKALDLYDRGFFTGLGTVQLFKHLFQKSDDVATPSVKTTTPKAVSAKKGPKKIARSAKSTEGDNEEGSTIMGTNGKAIKVSSKARPIAEDRTLVDASLKAMAKLEAEEAESRAADEEGYDPVDEDTLDPSERMGNEAVISGGRTTKKVKLETSILTKNKPEWIDSNGELTTKPNDDSISDAFIDKQEILDRAARDEDKFIE